MTFFKWAASCGSWVKGNVTLHSASTSSPLCIGSLCYEGCVMWCVRVTLDRFNPGHTRERVARGLWLNMQSRWLVMQSNRYESKVPSYVSFLPHCLWYFCCVRYLIRLNQHSDGCSASFFLAEFSKNRHRLHTKWNISMDKFINRFCLFNNISCDKCRCVNV